MVRSTMRKRNGKAISLLIFVLLTGALVFNHPFNGMPAGQQATPADIEARNDYLEVAHSLTRLIEHEINDKRIPSIAVALIDGRETVWAQGFGFADPALKRLATSATVYRV